MIKLPVGKIPDLNVPEPKQAVLKLKVPTRAMLPSGLARPQVVSAGSSSQFLMSWMSVGGLSDESPLQLSRSVFLGLPTCRLCLL